MSTTALTAKTARMVRLVLMEHPEQTERMARLASMGLMGRTVPMEHLEPMVLTVHLGQTVKMALPARSPTTETGPRRSLATMAPQSR